jgi:hypothetical protein
MERIIIIGNAKERQKRGAEREDYKNNKSKLRMLQGSAATTASGITEFGSIQFSLTCKLEESKG